MLPFCFWVWRGKWPGGEGWAVCGGDVSSFDILGNAPLCKGWWCKFHGGEGQNRSQVSTPESKAVS